MIPPQLKQRRSPHQFQDQFPWCFHPWYALPQDPHSLLIQREKQTPFQLLPPLPICLLQLKRLPVWFIHLLLIPLLLFLIDLPERPLVTTIMLLIH